MSVYNVASLFPDVDKLVGIPQTNHKRPSLPLSRCNMNVIQVPSGRDRTLVIRMTLFGQQ